MTLVGAGLLDPTEEAAAFLGGADFFYSFEFLSAFFLSAGFLATGFFSSFLAAGFSAFLGDALFGLAGALTGAFFFSSFLAGAGATLAGAYFLGASTAAAALPLTAFCLLGEAFLSEEAAAGAFFSLVASFFDFFSSSLRFPFSSRFFSTALTGDAGRLAVTFSGDLDFLEGAGGAGCFLTGVLSRGAAFPEVCVYWREDGGGVTSTSFFSKTDWERGIRWDGAGVYLAVGMCWR